MDQPKILVVEDESIIARDLANTLKSIGFDVPHLAVSGNEALKLIEADKPNLILMDIMMPGELDGIETAAKVKELYNIPVIYLTAYADDKIMDRAKQTEPYGYLIKPYEETELRFSIEMALYKHKAELERQKLLEELQDAMAKIKQLKGLLPICAWCKKVRDDKGYWSQVETYIQHHTNVEFTHGMCPDCKANMEKELDDIPIKK